MEEFILPKKVKRFSERLADQIRPVNITSGVFGYGLSNILFELGATKILCAVTIQQGVPRFLKGSKKGWLNAEYAMLPTSTSSRIQREIMSLKRNSRATEISRLISRVLRALCKFDVLGERTITVDCDVLQADGGTRTAAISGSFCALKLAEQAMLFNGMIDSSFIIGDVAAISVGILDGQPLVDLDFIEDSKAFADFNFVLTSNHSLIEVQGSVEKALPIDWKMFDRMKDLAAGGVDQIFDYINKILDKSLNSIPSFQEKSAEKKAPFFSLKNRFNQEKY